MQPDQAADYVAGILTRNRIEFATRDDGKAHMFTSGSTAVFINLSGWGNDDSVINIQAVAVEQIPESAGQAVLDKINELNCEGYFAKWCRYGSELKVEHDLIASRLQADELMNALSAVVGQADAKDDELASLFGAKTWQQVQNEQSEDSEALET
jgi:hypothetical protein